MSKIYIMIREIVFSFLKTGSCPLSHGLSAQRIQLAQALKRRTQFLLSKINLLTSLKTGSCIAFVLLAAGCSLSPTKVYETKEGFSTVLQAKTKKPIRITDETAIVDARTRFDYTMSHHPKAVNLRWESFAQTKSQFPGRFIDDLEGAKKRLALLGLNPKKPVIVIGYGNKGEAEAGRMAWTLLYMGFDDVQIIDDSILSVTSNIVDPNPPKNAKDWPLQLRIHLIASKKEVLSAMTLPEGSTKNRTFLIDVRSKEEYFHKEGVGKNYSIPDLGAVHIEWKEFFDQQGRPQLDIKNQLKAIGISENNTIIILSNRGVRSAAVNAALISMGFYKSKTFVDGLESLRY